MSNIITMILLIFAGVLNGYYWGYSWLCIVAIVCTALALIFNVVDYHKAKKNKLSKSKLESLRSQITYYCLATIGWESVGSGIIGDKAIEVWNWTPDGKKGKKCIYMIDDDKINLYLSADCLKEFADDT